MLLLWMRHGIAEELREGQTDALRALTEIGHQKTREALCGLQNFQNKIELIVSSPLLRAVETAQIAAEIFGNSEPQIWPELEHAEYSALAQRLKISDATSVLLVGHEPGFSRGVARFLTGHESGLVIPFKKAGVCALDVDWSTPEPRAVLLWHASPKMLRLMSLARAPKPKF